MLYHSDCLDEINKFDRWILVNQGDLEKLKDKKAKKETLFTNNDEYID